MDPLAWYEDPKLWLQNLRNHLELLSSDPKTVLSWVVTQHQTLTLAKNSSLSALWFQMESQPCPLWGVALSKGRLVLTSPEVDLNLFGPAGKNKNLRKQDLAILTQRFHPETLIASKALIKFLGIHGAIQSNQKAWWRPHWKVIPRLDPDITIRRAQEADRSLVDKFAQAFSAELKTEAQAEAAAWLNRNRLLLFEKNKATLGMAALSGEYQDPMAGILTRLSLLFVEPRFRNSGIGSMILHLIAAECLTERKSLVLYSDADNPLATSFYHKAGFQELGELTELSVKIIG